MQEQQRPGEATQPQQEKHKFFSVLMCIDLFFSPAVLFVKTTLRELDLTIPRFVCSSGVIFCTTN